MPTSVQAIRNEADLACLAVPAKYRQLGGFNECVAVSLNDANLFEQVLRRAEEGTDADNHHRRQP
jgi:hypothetical protein